MSKTVIALGFFDGIHLGHKAVLEKTMQRAGELGAEPCVYTFDCPPRQVVTGSPVPLISTPYDRKEQIGRLFGIENVIFDHFDDALMHLPWDSFITEILSEKYQAIHLVAGHDYHFGAGNQGTPDLLQSKCQELGIGCDIIPAVEKNGQRVSSTLIRKLIEEGSIQEANMYLGHSYSVTGTVVHGNQLGRSIDTPTVNFPLPDGIVVPKLGVYASRVYLEDGRSYPGITNIGKRPTVSSSGEINVETFLFHFEGNLYDTRIRVELKDFIRPEQHFSSLEELKNQIHKDIVFLSE